MDPIHNPFAPSAGRRPPELAGREDILSSAKVAYQRVMRDRHARPMMLLGLRGTGKTVLLNEFKRIGETEGLLVSRIEAPEDASLARLIVPEMRKIMRSLSGIEAAKQYAVRGLRGLQNFASVFDINAAGIGIGVEGASEPEPGLADSGDIQFDLPELFENLGKAAQAANKAWLLLIDEVQYLNSEDLSALIVSLHMVSQGNLPIAFAGAGLPQVAKLAGEAKSYAERLFIYPPIGPLDRAAATDAIEKPIVNEGALVSSDAVGRIFEATSGYPFFLQEWSYHAWDAATGPEITLADVENIHETVIQSLDDGFFKVRMDRLTRAETEFVAAMANLGDGPYAISDVAQVLKRKTQSLGPARASIIHKGMVYSPEHGQLAFTVPLFAEFMRRQYGSINKSSNRRK
ncbi:MAG: ATP-binding protein [Paracoccaceae bacterium]|jgi:hypothetical protein|nr:ATP-binding protein [Paracoccaceae bacterium]MDP7185944.1 ATP-binding protein [Paracoccaceae bacterium]